MTSHIRHPIGNLESLGLENGEVQVKTAFRVYRRTRRRIIGSFR